MDSNLSSSQFGLSGNMGSSGTPITSGAGSGAFSGPTPGGGSTGATASMYGSSSSMNGGC